MKTLNFFSRRPTPERVRAAVEATKKKAAYKQYLKSAKYCQRCGKEVYPDKEGRYPLYEIEDERYGIPLLVCESCKMKKMSKYNSTRAVCNQGHTHASIKEAGRCSELSLMVKAGVITNLKQQPEFILQRAFKYRGKTIREIKYRADFSYYDVEKKKFIVEDVKGGLATRTEVYMLKKKMLLYIMRDREDFEFFENI